MVEKTQGRNIAADITGGTTLKNANNRVSNIIAVDVLSLKWC